MNRYTTPLKILKREDGKRYYSTVLPDISVVDELSYTITSVLGDRWDTLAHKYYGLASLWYVIAAANHGLNGSIFIKPGTKVVIPNK